MDYHSWGINFQDYDISNLRVQKLVTHNELLDGCGKDQYTFDITKKRLKVPYSAQAYFSDATVDTIYGFYYFSYYSSIELSEQDTEYCGKLAEARNASNN